MDGVDALGVLGRQRRGGGHGIAAVGRDDFLVGFKATVFGGACVCPGVAYCQSCHVPSPKLDTQKKEAVTSLT